MQLPITKLFSLLLLLLLPFTAIAELEDQPDEYSSSLSTNSGAPVYDWELANMVEMWIIEQGFANMMFIFNQCYAGGMMDDIGTKIPAGGDVAMMGAAKHNEVSWGLADGYNPANYAAWAQQTGFNREEDYYAKEVGEELAKTGSDAKTALEIATTAAAEDLASMASFQGTDPVETPQSAFYGDGEKIKLGQKTSGAEVASRHVIMFMGIPDGLRHWNDLDRAYNAFLAHGFTASDIVVLAGDGATGPGGGAKPAYVDGAGTRTDLFNAFTEIGPQMNENEQFVFWASDHGNRDLTTTALDRVITDPTKQPVPRNDTDQSGSGKWTLDSIFLKDLKRKGSTPFVSLMIDISLPELAMDNLELYFNGKKIKAKEMTPVYALDNLPDLDGYEFVYPIKKSKQDSGKKKGQGQKKSKKRGTVKRVNKLEFKWKDQASFIEFTLLGAHLGLNATTQPNVPPKKYLEGGKKKKKKGGKGKKNKNKNKGDNNKKDKNKTDKTNNAEILLKQVVGNFDLSGNLQSKTGNCVALKVGETLNNPHAIASVQDKKLVITNVANIAGELGKKGAYSGAGNKDLTPGLSSVTETLEGTFTRKGKAVSFSGTLTVKTFLADKDDCEAVYQVNMIKTS